MELRYLGFEQQENSRAYRFEAIEKGRASRRFVVVADLSLFTTHHVGFQYGPTICATKLTADLERQFDGLHQLTADDLRVHAEGRKGRRSAKAGE